MIKRKGLSFLLCTSIVFSIIFSGCASEDNTDTKVTSETTSKNNVTSSSDNKNNKKKNPAEKDGKYHPGDVVSFGDFKITYKSIKKYKSDNEFLQPKKGFQYVKYSFTFKNIGKKDAFIGDFSCYANGEKCENAYVNDSDDSIILTELSSGRKKSGSMIFEVPKKVKLKDLELEYEDNDILSDKKIIFLAK